MTQILNWYSHIHDCLYCTIVSVNDSLMWALEALAFDDRFVPHGPLAHYHWSKGTRGSLIYLSRHRYFLVIFSRTTQYKLLHFYINIQLVCVYTQLQAPLTVCDSCNHLQPLSHCTKCQPCSSISFHPGLCYSHLHTPKSPLRRSWAD